MNEFENLKKSDKLDHFASLRDIDIAISLKTTKFRI